MQLRQGQIELAATDLSARPLWPWSHEAIDTNLAGTALQLCLSSDLVAEVQHSEPDVITSGPDRSRISKPVATYPESTASSHGPRSLEHHRRWRLR